MVCCACTKIRRSLLIAVSIAFWACGKDEADFVDLKDEVGAIPGNFNLRLAKAYREQVDGLQSKLDTLVPGASTKLSSRLSEEEGDETTVDGADTKLSDLLNLKVPGTESEFLNQRLFGEIANFSGDFGPWFDQVDTQKYLKGPSTYDPPASGEPDFDPSLSAQYYLEMIRWHEAVEGIDDAQLADAAPVVVAVLDTGVYAEHEDLTGVMWQNSGAAVGYDATKSTTSSGLAKSLSTDGNGHGTHVAGIIAGEGKNAKGIHGVGYLPRSDGKPITEIMNVKVLNDNGAGTSEQIAGGIKWAVNQHWQQKNQGGTRSNQKMIINMSLGGPFDTSGYNYKSTTDTNGNKVFTDDVINYATSKKDVLIVVAAGNESCKIGGSCDLFGSSYQQTYYYPCSYANVLCVAATTHEDKLAGFSNRRASVGIAAPGWQILSTLPESKTSYGYYSGTSQATPVTSGAAAIVWSLYPDFEAEDLKEILRKTASRVETISGEIASGDGRLDLKAALLYAKALAADGKRPSEVEPESSWLDNSAQSATQVPPGGADPNAPSQHAVANDPNDQGQGSARGCAVVAADHSINVGSWLVLLMLTSGLSMGLHGLLRVTNPSDQQVSRKKRG